jgi:alpha-L-fucosidase 2
MVVELSSLQPVRINVELNTDLFDKEASYSASAQVDGNILCLTRETRNTSKSRWVSRNAYAARIFGATHVAFTAVDASHARAEFEIPANATVKVVTCLDGGKNAANPLPAAKQRVAVFTDSDIPALKEKHRSWWKTHWWLKSYVRTYDDTMDKHYFRCLYQLGTMCREGFVNSGLHGPWKASDTRHNYSSFCMNDMGACSYYLALMSANRASTAKMWIQTVYDWIPEGQRRAVNDAHLARGVFFPVHCGPWGSTYESNYWGQKFCASLASVVGDWYYRDTEDVAYLRERIYPFMKECADFYEGWLTKEADGKYHVQGASYESPGDNFQNSCEDLFVARILFTDILKYSRVLGVDSERRGKWEDIRDHLNDFSTTTENGLTVYKADSSTPFEVSVNIIQTEIIYPGYSCNRRSAPEIRQIGYNTILQAAKFGGWSQDNMRGEGLFVAAQRIGGFKVDDLITHYKAMLAIRPIDFPGYIADAGLWEFNNQLCIQCYDHDVMFFPDYPSDRKLSFKRLRAPGAFLCSGEFRNGAAADLKVYSEKGNPFTVLGTSPLEVREVGGNLMPTRKNGDKYTFDTIAGKTYRITRPSTAAHPAESE